jgi:hypothetical protein
MQFCLNGLWDCGLNRNYDRTAQVPGLAVDPSVIAEGTLWYRRSVSLPPGNWTGATLELCGARFAPKVYVNGAKVSEVAGGMAPTFHRLASPDVRPGAAVTIEIELAGLRDIPADDASRIPAADLWRSNVSSCLWDDVRLRLHGPQRIARLIPSTHPADGEIRVRWELEPCDGNARPRAIGLEVLSAEGEVLREIQVPSPAAKGEAVLDVREVCRPWSPEAPNLYRLRARLLGDAGEWDAVDLALGLREFRVDGLGFSLNSRPTTLRAGTVVWHRWVRDPEARELGWDVDWFERNIARRLKDRGANGLRFHLGSPPERLLDLCDRLGLMVQIEWPFFHGMKASRASLLEQWRNWLDLCLRHPCVCLIHPWNETEGDELSTAFGTLEELRREYPPLVISHRDVLHVHKYWWSLFENVGVYYDAREQFSQPVMADEFGGNYLDGECNAGLYPSLKESFLRFLGRGHTKELRLELHTQANARVAEYWRRLGVAGFSPFCIAGSREDGNNHFLGPLREGNPKPVWDALTAAYSPLSCSLDVWDRNFEPGDRVKLPLHLFNETPRPERLNVNLRISSLDGREVVYAKEIGRDLPAQDHEVLDAEFYLPVVEGDWRFEAELRNPPPGVKHPVVSSWRFRTMTARVPRPIDGVRIACRREEAELRQFLGDFDLDVAEPGDAGAKVMLAGLWTWEHLADAGVRESLADAISRGVSVVMLDVGPRPLGQGYREDGLGPLQGNEWIPQPKTFETELFLGLRLRSTEMPEPESCLHPSAEDDSLWENLDRQSTWLWNGLRGGLLAPACDMELVGLSPSAFLATWAARGADAGLIRAGRCVAYELAGFYAFSEQPDKAVSDALREKVRFLVEDAPALKLSINPSAPIRTIDLGELYRQSVSGRAESLLPLANVGKSLSRSPVVLVGFGKGQGSMVVSQLLTAGRLARGFGQDGPYGIRFDVAARQFVLNMLSRSLA